MSEVDPNKDTQAITAEEPQSETGAMADDGITMFGSIKRATIGLALFAIVTAGLIAGTQILTKERIEEQIALAKSKALFEIVPANEHDNSMLAEAFTIVSDELGLDELNEAYYAKNGDLIETLIFPIVAPDGYSGKIRMILGINRDGSIRGVRVVSHQETPGLGDKIELQKSDWILGFNGKSLQNPSPDKWQVKKDGGDFDQLTGATITPRSIVHAIRSALEFFDQNKTLMLNVAPGMIIDGSVLSRVDQKNEAQ